MARNPLSLCTTLLVLAFCSCAPYLIPPDPPPPGYSGMAQLGASSYVVVHDTKSGAKDRLGWIEVTANAGARYSPITVESWPEDDVPADLESICAIPQKPGQFLVAESGCWEKEKTGHLFRIAIDQGRAQVLGEPYDLPCPKVKAPNLPGDEYEGLACVALDVDRVLVLLGERGGSRAYPRGFLRWGVLELKSGRGIQWKDGVLEIPEPPWEGSAQTRRDVMDLHADSQGIVWAVAGADAGDLGPFVSVVYEVGRIKADAAKPFEKATSSSQAWRIEGFKVEGLSGPAAATGCSRLSIATEDEDFGGIWRPLPHRTQKSPGCGE